MVVHMNTPRNRLGGLMAEQGMSVNALAEATAIARATLIRRLADPSTFTLNETERVAAALHVDPPVLFAIARAS